MNKRILKKCNKAASFFISYLNEMEYLKNIDEGSIFSANKERCLNNFEYLQRVYYNDIIGAKFFYKKIKTKDVLRWSRNFIKKDLCKIQINKLRKHSNEHSN